MEQAKNQARAGPVGARKRALKDGPPATVLVGAPCKHPSEVTHEGVNPVAYRLALNNGSQCGYCSVGFVMNMSEFLINHPHATKKEIEEAFDGNICRCTGYRAILTGMKTFASNWNADDEKNRMKCLQDPGSAGAAARPTWWFLPAGGARSGPADHVERQRPGVADSANSGRARGDHAPEPA